MNGLTVFGIMLRGGNVPEHDRKIVVLCCQSCGTAKPYPLRCLFYKKFAAYSASSRLRGFFLATKARRR
jgi:hypothetical protein